MRERFSTPETVPFWELAALSSTCAEHAGLAAAGYRLQYQKLLSRPFLLAAMVLLAAAFSLRFFRFGGVQKMVLGGVASGFLLYVLSKVTDDLSKAELMPPDRRRVAARRDRRPDRVSRAAVPGGRVMAARCRHSAVRLLASARAARLASVAAVAALVAGCALDTAPAQAQIC